MADDIITFGGPEGRARRDAGESVESLFHAHYPRIVSTAFSLVGDWDLAEHLAQEAYLRLWRRWRWIADPQAAPMYLQLYLQRTVVNLSRETIRRKIIERRAPTARGADPPGPPAPDPAAVVELRRAIAALPVRKRERVVLRFLLGWPEAETADVLGLEQRLRDLKPAGKQSSGAGRPIDTAAAWREFQSLRSRSVTLRRRVLAVAAAAAVAGLAIAFPALTGAHNGSGGNGPQPATGIPAAPRTYPKSVAGLIPMSGVTAVVGDAAHVWVVRAVTNPGVATTYQLAGLDLRTNSVMFSTRVGRQSPSIAAGDGRLWLTTPYGQVRGQIVRADLATGQVLSTIHLRARGCSQLAFGSGHLFAACGDVRSSGTDIWRINSRTQRAFRLAGPVHGFVSSMTAAPEALWYAVNYQGIRGLWNINGVPQPVAAHVGGYTQTVPGQQSLVYADGAIWALSGGERLAKIDPFTGHVLRRFTYRNYDPRRAGGLDFLTAGNGWLWFLDNGYPFSGVLRVSESTGRPAGGVRIPPNSCGQQVCSQIFYTPGSVWVPTAELLIRIDTSRLPG